jgi:hypothetical protein
VRGIDRWLRVLTVSILVALLPRPSLGNTEHELRAGAVEAAANGSFTRVEGTSSASMGLAGGYIARVGAVAVRLRGGFDYARVAELDRVDFYGAAHVLRRIASSSAYPYVGVAGGMRQEWVGSFSQSRYPLGVDAGLTALVSASAAVGIGYEFRRVFDDPVSNYNEHRVVFGLSILFRNR